MYSWGDDTSTWKAPGKYDYGSAMKPYLEKNKAIADEKGDRTYLSKKAPNLSLVDPKGKDISTESEHPIIIAVDGTGSMQTWPAEIFDRLPLLYQTLSKYKPDVELSFSVIGDAALVGDKPTDKWPTQVSNFGKGPTLDDYLKALQPEGGGGPGIRESYELWAHYINTHAQTPKATTPFLFIMGDEKFYETIDPAQVKRHIGDTLGQALDSRETIRSLAQKFDVYLLRKSYAGRDAEIEAQWKEVLAPQHIIPVSDPTRVVDIAMGIVAKNWGAEGDFVTNLSARQDSKGIATVMESLRAAPVTPTGTNSKLVGKASGKKSMKLGV